MLDKARRILRKYVEYVITKIRILWEQRVFSFEGVDVKYILKRRDDADSLVVVFSACTRKGLKARYNYVKTLNGLRCNRLYILDDYGEDHRGSYYMGHDFGFEEERAVKELIRKMIARLEPQRTIFCGSSKGGYAALNFGLEFAGSDMIIGAPQYFLTSYLLESENLHTLNHIMGERTPEKEQRLEFYLRNRLQSAENKESHTIYLHFSDQEHTYEEHIKYMLKDMEENGYKVEKDIADYTNHSDLSYYFPDFLKRNVKKIIEQAN